MQLNAIVVAVRVSDLHVCAVDDCHATLDRLFARGVSRLGVRRERLLRLLREDSVWAQKAQDEREKRNGERVARGEFHHLYFSARIYYAQMIRIFERLKSPVFLLGSPVAEQGAGLAQGRGHPRFPVNGSLSQAD